MSSPSWIDITNIIISALGLIVIVLAAASLFVANRQLKVMQEQTKKPIAIHEDNMKWSKSTLQNEKLFETPGIDIEIKIAKVLKAHNIESYDKIQECTYEELFNNPESWIPIKYFLNHYETLCVALSGGLVDAELAYNLHSNRVVILWGQWGGFCKHVQKRLNDQEIYWEIEKWAGKFENELIKRRELEGKKRADAEKMIAQGKGMRELAKTGSQT
jgi:hypothetical protein